MEKFNTNDKVRIVNSLINTHMNGVEGVIVWISRNSNYTSYLLRIDAERYKKAHVTVGWSLENCDNGFPASIRERYADDPHYKFWFVSATEIAHVEDEDTEIAHVEDEDTEYHDTHYKACIIEPILVMHAVLPPEQFKGFLRGNALKYRLRAGHKEDAISDIDKALRYEQWLKEYEETGVITL